MTLSPAARKGAARVRGWLALAPRTDRRLMMSTARVVVLIFAGILNSLPSSAQAPTTLDREPIRCWWRTTNGAVQTGELFTVVLTCAVLEQETVQVVADETQLDPTTISLTPFEVVSGSQPPDLRTGDRRFFQRVYNLRIISPDAIGEDVRLPPVAIRYRVQNRTSGAGAVEGRELLYLLPPQAIRVLSVVPEEATDIRDTGAETFDEIPALTSRGNILRIASVGLIGLGVIMAVLALVRLIAGKSKKPKTDAAHLSAPLLLGAVSKELEEVQREAAQIGWSDALVGRTLAALRVGAACALGRGIGQRIPSAQKPPQEGQLLVRRRGRGAVAVSSGVTPEDLRSALDGRVDAGLAPSLEALRSALATFTTAHFGRQPSADRSALDEAAAAGAAAVSKIASEHAWPRAYLRWKRPATEVESYT